MTHDMCAGSCIYLNILWYFMLLCAVTPSGSCSSPPQEYQEGEAGFAVMFPSIEGVHIKPFHFCKKTISPTALKEAGECRLTELIQ